ncbi:serine/threonine-protein phosphatase 7 long form like protein [Quercus suber]|uniref:Serine/threonine-protein phosphatase 7 long form like protein n=1 Tax=Quercus suber TaxID=58331 RepID=A0AAW0JXC3_QUESU
MEGLRIKAKWLEDRFSNPLPADATEMLGGTLFMDKSGERVLIMYLQFFNPISNGKNYSWCSAALSWLYKHLCKASEKKAKQIGGALLLVQFWAWARFPHICPVIRHLHQALPPGPLAIKWAAHATIADAPPFHREMSYNDEYMVESQLRIMAKCEPRSEIYTDYVNALQSVEEIGRLTLDDARAAGNTSELVVGRGRQAGGRQGRGGRQSNQRHTSS